MSEFNLIQNYFNRSTAQTLLGIGDDAALIQVCAGQVLAVSTDMLVSGTHFFPDADPFKLGHKALAVNLSDMAAMGAIPRWVTLAIALPNADATWLESFSAGFFALATQHQVDLIGGDTTRGALNICVSVFGETPFQQAIRRDGAQIGDDIWVSGYLGDAALALQHMLGNIQLSTEQFEGCAVALHTPQPRISLGLALRGIAHSALDISDGLLGDLGHILKASKVGARLNLANIPCSECLTGYLNTSLGLRCLLSGGDDYELCFTAAPQLAQTILDIGTRLNLRLSRIGEITNEEGCRVISKDGNPLILSETGYDHFK